MILNTIVLCGAQRVGKSIFANRIRRELGVKVISTDALREEFFPEGQPSDVRKMSAYNLISRLIRENPTHTIIEGVSAYNLCRVQIRQKKFGTPVIFLGYTGDENAKRKGIGSYRESNACWTERKKFTNEQLDRLATTQVKLSKNQKIFCERYSLPFFEISPDQFDYDMQKAINWVKSNLSLTD